MLNSFEILLVVLVPLDEEALESSFVRGVCAAMLADLPLLQRMRRGVRDGELCSCESRAA